MNTDAWACLSDSTHIFSEKGSSNPYPPNAKFTESYIYYFQTSVNKI